MSAVTPDEIVEIAARVFDVEISEIKCRRHKLPKLVWARYARLAATALILRHTSLLPYKIPKLLGQTGGGAQGQYSYDTADRFFAEVARHAPLAALVAKCEKDIDRLHDARTARRDRGRRAAPVLAGEASS